MMRLLLFSGIFIILFSHCAVAQSGDSLRQRIQQIISAKQVKAGVAISDAAGNDTVSINGEKHFPLQSVFKFHIALCVLSQVDEGKLSLHQKIKFEKKDLLPGLYSPIRDGYPEGVTLRLSTVLHYTVAMSDNAGCDMLLRLIGGPAAVDAYFANHHFSNVSIKINEETQQANWDRQFENWTTPLAANAVLAAFYSNDKKLLSKKSYDFIWKTMKGTSTGSGRLKGGLPPLTIVAHKTGTSGANKEGLSAAVNDMGIVFMPDGQYYYISVFVTDSHEDAATNEKIIADISKTVWEYFLKKKND